MAKGKNFNDFTYGVGLEVNASSFKQVKDDLKLNLNNLSKMVKSYEKILKINPNADLSDLFNEVNKIKSITDGIGGSNNPFSGFVDKGVLDRISTLEKGLVDINSISRETQLSVDGLKNSITQMLEPLKSAGQAKLPGTFDNLFGSGGKVVIDEIEEATDKLKFLETKLCELNSLKNEYNKHRLGQGSKIGMDASLDEIDDWLDEYESLIRRFKDKSSKLDPKELNEISQKIVDVGIKIRNALSIDENLNQVYSANANFIAQVGKNMDGAIVYVDKAIASLEKRKQDLKTTLDGLLAEQSKLKSDISIKSSNTNNLGIIPGQKGEIVLDPKISTTDWKNKINTIIQDLGAFKVQVIPTLFKTSTNTKKELDGELSKITHQLTANLKVEDNLGDFETRVKSITNSIQNAKSQIEQNAKFKISFTYAEGEDFKKLVLQEINKFKKIKASFHIANGKKFMQDVSRLQVNSQKKLSDIPATIKLENQDSFLASVDTLRTEISNKVGNIGVGLGFQNMSQIAAQASLIKDDLKNVGISVDNTSFESGTKKVTDGIEKMSDKAQEAQKSIENIKTALRSLNEEGINSKHFLSLGDIDKSGKVIPGSKNQLKQKLSEYSVLSQKLSDATDIAEWYSRYPEAKGNNSEIGRLIRNDTAKQKQLENELNSILQRQLNYYSEMLLSAEAILKKETEITFVKKEQEKINVKSSKAAAANLEKEATVGITDIRKIKKQLLNDSRKSNTILKSVNTKGINSPYFTKLGEWDESTGKFKRNSDEVQQLINKYNELKKARIDSGKTSASAEEKRAYQQLNNILLSQKKHIAEKVSELEKEHQIVSQIVKQYNSANASLKKQDRLGIKQIQEGLFKTASTRQNLAKDAMAILQKGQLGDNRYNFNALVKTGIGDVNKVLGTGRKSELKQTVDFYYKLIEAQDALVKSGMGDSKESQDNLQILHNLKEQLKAVWQDQMRYCQDQISGYDREKQKIQEVLELIKRLASEKAKAASASKKNTKTKNVNVETATQQDIVVAKKTAEELEALSGVITKQKKYLVDLNKDGIQSSSFVKLGEWDKAEGQFKKNSGHIKTLLAQYDQLKQARQNAGIVKPSKEESSLRGKLVSILKEQKKHVSEIISKNQAELESAKQISNAYKEVSNEKSKTSKIKTDVDSETATKKINDLTDKLKTAQKALEALKKNGWNALSSTGLGDVKGRLGSGSKGFDDLMQTYNDLITKKKELESKGIKDDSYANVVNALKGVNQQLTIIYQDQVKYTESAISNLESEIAKEKELLQTKQAQTQEEKKQTQEQAKQATSSKKKSTSVKTQQSLTAKETASKSTDTATINPNDLARETTLKAIDGKVNSILSKLGGNIKITGSNINIDASNVSVSGKGVKDSGGTKGTTKKSEDKGSKSGDAGVKTTTISSNLRQLAEFEERAKQSGVYSDKLREKFAALRKELSSASKSSDVDAYKIHLDKFKTEFAQIKTFKGLYDNLIQSKAKQLKLEHEINNSAGSTQKLKEELKLEQEKSEKIERHLSKYTQLYDQRNKELAVTKAIQQANEEIAKSSADKIDRGINKQNSDLLKVIDSAQKKLNEMKLAMQSSKVPMADSAILKFTEYEQLLIQLKQKQQEIANNPALLGDENYTNSFNMLLQQMQKVHTEFTGLQKASDGFLKKIRSTEDIKPLASTVSVDNLEQMHDVMQDFANTAGVGKAKLIEFNDANRTGTFEIRNSRGQVQQLTVAYDAATNSLGRYTTQTRESTSESQKFIKGLKQSFQNVARYIASFGSVYRVFAMLKQGVTYVKEIDSALTELKKVTDETDVSYDRFLQNMSKTASVVGSTVSELTTMAAEWARLNI